MKLKESANRGRPRFVTAGFWADPRCWCALGIGLALTLLSALAGGRELDGIPVSMMVYGLPLWWLKIQSATRFCPSFQTTWSIGPFLVIDVFVWSAPLLLALYIARGLRLSRFRQQVAAGMCGGCGYNLTGNRSGVCPECGAPIQSSDSESSTPLTGAVRP